MLCYSMLCSDLCLSLLCVGRLEELSVHIETPFSELQIFIFVCLAHRQNVYLKTGQLLNYIKEKKTINWQVLSSLGAKAISNVYLRSALGLPSMLLLVSVTRLRFQCCIVACAVSQQDKIVLFLVSFSISVSLLVVCINILLIYLIFAGL